MCVYVCGRDADSRYGACVHWRGSGKCKFELNRRFGNTKKLGWSFGGTDGLSALWKGAPKSIDRA